MLTPGSPLPAYTISQLDQLQTPTTQLAGALLEFEIGIGGGNFKNVRGTTEELAQYLATLLGVGAPGFSIAFRPNGDAIVSPELAEYIDTGGEVYWISPDASGQRTTINAASFGVAPGNTASENATGITAMRSTLQTQGQ